jgi:hypothetical protein
MHHTNLTPTIICIITVKMVTLVNMTMETMGIPVNMNTIMETMGIPININTTMEMTNTNQNMIIMT